MAPADHIFARLNAILPNPTMSYRIHGEAIEFGRDNDRDQCNDSPLIDLPGWMEIRGNSFLGTCMVPNLAGGLGMCF
jgi:hypothetical protein